MSPSFSFFYAAACSVMAGTPAAILGHEDEATLWGWWNIELGGARVLWDIQERTGQSCTNHLWANFT